MGRPSKFSDALAAEICERIEGGRALTSVCEDADMPSKPTVTRWLEANETFRNFYARACEGRAASIAEQALTIADALPETATSEQVQAARLQVDTRKWFAAKLAPKKFGDRVTTESKVDTTVHGSLDVRVSQMSDDELARILADAAAENAPGTGGGAGVAKKKG